MYKNNLLFEGYYGHHNTGDDAFIEVASWGARKFWNILCPIFIAQNFPIIHNHGKYLGQNLFKGHFILKYVKAIAVSNIFVSAGGSTFHSPISILNPKNIAQIKKKYYPNYKIGAIGVSLGPFISKTAEADNIKLLKSFDFLSLRDRKSYEIALTYNLPYEPVDAFDLAALLPEVYSASKEIKNQQKIIGISICNYERFLINGNIKNEERRNRNMEELLIRITKMNSDISFRFFVFNGNLTLGDSRISHELANKLKKFNSNVEVIEYDPNIYRTWLRMKECKLIISTRLHAAIFACFANIPFYLNEYHRKCTDFLHDVGYDQKSRIYDADFLPSELAGKIVRQLLGEDSYMIPLYLNQMIEKSKFNFTKINISH